MIDKITQDLNVSRETIAALEAYVQLLEKWNKSINLVAKSTIEEVWERHIRDSSQLFEALPDSARKLADIGSGGGLPGLILAIIAKEKRPDLAIVLVESDARKCAFLTSVATKLGLEVRVENNRIEQLPTMSADVITARALASLDQLNKFSHIHLKDGGESLFLKGQGHLKEIEAARKMWCFDVETIQSVTNLEAAIVRIRNLSPR